LRGDKPAEVDSSTTGSRAAIADAPTPLKPAPKDFKLDAGFLDYLRVSANPKRLGFNNGRFFPYSTPQGRRIASGLAVWNKDLFSEGCTEAEANEQLIAELYRSESELRAMLAKRSPAVAFASLTSQQREVLLDFVHTEGVKHLREDFLTLVLAGDWPRIFHEHSYVRYYGTAPDHSRNKAFAGRFQKN
jgi:hypothetical protein